MNGCGKSDRSMETWEPSEQGWVGIPSAEEGEGRGLTKENRFQQNKCRTLGRARGGSGEP